MTEKLNTIITAKHPSGVNITFNEEEHTYVCNDIYYDSVTQIIHKMFPEFNTELVSGRYAKKHGLKQQDVINEWAENNKLACDFGTKVHLYCENLMMGKELPKADNEKEKTYFKVADKFITSLLKLYDIVKCEQIIFSPRLRLAGTVDIIMRKKSDGRLAIFDWKTNRKLEKKSEWGESGLRFFSHLSHCNYIHYCIQLNVYRFLLYAEKYYDCKDSPMKLFHITPDGVKIYGIIDMHKEISMLLTPRIKNK
jgi:ATP-dependent exoDNAse (exonuclease V) beta subunit